MLHNINCIQQEAEKEAHNKRDNLQCSYFMLQFFFRYYDYY